MDCAIVGGRKRKIAIDGSARRLFTMLVYLILYYKFSCHDRSVDLILRGRLRQKTLKSSLDYYGYV